MNFLKEIELRLIPVTIQMEISGFSINQKELSKVKTLLETTKSAIESSFPINLNSPKQLKEYLIKLGFSNDLTTYLAHGQAQSTNRTVLKHLVSKTPLAQKILDYRQSVKLLNTYVEPMSKVTKWVGNFNQVGTMTGRYSSSNPNLQNIPARTDIGKRIRSCLTAQLGHKLIISDLSQIEPRLIAFFSKDPKLMALYDAGGDFHTDVTRAIYNIPIRQEPSKEQRFVGKTVGLATLYGARTKRLQETLFNYGIDLSYAKVNNIRNSIIIHYPIVWQWASKMNYNGPRMTKVETLLKRRIPVLPSMNIVNTLIQGSCSDIIKTCMLNLHESNYKIIASIHDEVVIEIPKDFAEDEIGSIKDIMEKSVRLRNVNIKSDTVLVDNWGEK